MEINEEFLTGLGVSEEQSDEILAQYRREKFDASARRILAEAGARDCEAALTLLGDGINSDNFEEKIENLKRKHPALFEEKRRPRFAAGAEANNIGRGEFEKMSYRERLELFRKSPDAYKRMV